MTVERIVIVICLLFFAYLYGVGSQQEEINGLKTKLQQSDNATWTCINRLNKE